jgi:HK97 family phage portal protein
MWPFTRQKAATTTPSLSGLGGWRVLEPFAGAWQTGTTLDVQDVTGYPTLFACLDRISSDIGKLPWHVKQRGSDGIGRIVPNKRLERPNGFQTPSQFRQAWVLALLQQGNAVVLRSPELIVLDWDHVTPLVSEAGEVFYRVSSASRSVMPAEFNGRTVTVPASAVMHDRRACLFNQLVGVPPLTAAFLPAAKNYFALTNAKNRFAKGDNMGGVLTVPASIDEASAA